MEFNGAAVSSLESTLRGRGNGGWHRYGRGSGGGTAWDAKVALSATAAGWMGSGGAASDWRRETKEERAEWAAKAGWGGFGNGKQK
jgi:hypothetical protein